VTERSGTVGVRVTTNGATGVSCVDCKIVGGAHRGNAGDGIAVQGSSSGTKINDASCVDNGNYGIELGGTSSRTIITASTLQRNIEGIHVVDGVKGTQVFATDVSLNTNYGINALDDIVIDGLIARGGNATNAVYFKHGKNHSIANYDIQSTASGWQAIAANGRLKIGAGRVALEAADGVTQYGIISGGYGAEIFGGAMTITIASGATGTAKTALYLNAIAGPPATGDTFWWGEGFDPTACATEVTNVAGSFLSWGQVTGAAGTTTIAFPNAKTFSQVLFRMESAAGTPTRMPTAAVTKNTSFAITFAAGDTSLYRWTITT
jgi:hypothetical protein